jgi:exo-1,4-beta-D-glucosaminidase
MPRSRLVRCFATLAGLFAAGAGSAAERTESRRLHDGWALQSSCQVRASGEEISRPGFRTQGWHAASVPTTVVAALVADGTYKDPFVGTNLRSLPGMDYPVGKNFSNLPMPQDSPFRCSWWYRTEFASPAAPLRNLWLHFDGLNYRANVWLNGQKVADAKDVVGTFRVFEFDVTRLLRGGAPSALAVEVFAPEEKDLAITWVDWNPGPADRNMGIWRDVVLSASGDVTLRNAFVSSRLDAGGSKAALTLSADLHNVSKRTLKGVLRGEVDRVRVSEPLELPPGESRTVSLTPEHHPELVLNAPRLWWPYALGEPNLYTATLTFDIGVLAPATTSSNASAGVNPASAGQGKPPLRKTPAARGITSDTAQVRFGIREVTAEPSTEGHRLFKINGRKLLIRGGGWSSDMLLRYSPERARAELSYVKHMGLNTVRQEGKLEPDEFYAMADEMGILMMPGWCCCDFWERWAQWTPEHYAIAGASLTDQLRRLRTHPSVFVWLYGSDNPPNAQAEQMYVRILQEQRWPNPALSSATEKPAPVSGDSGVKMTGPYDYVPPNYWLVDKQLGGAHGFNTETSPGPAIPPLESLKRFLPADHLWPIDDVWNYHSGGNRFATLDVFRKALDGRYGKPETLPDFLRKSEAMAYEGQRAMFEAYARNKYAATGVIQWMLNNAWPSLIWHLYDYYLVPAGGYFGTRKACETVHVQYSYDDGSVAVINGRQEPLPGLKVSARVYGLDASEKASREAVVDMPADSSTRAFELPKPEAPASAYFARLQLRDGTGRLLSDNFYWLSSTRDVLDWAQTKGTAYTPQLTYADLSGLAGLPQVEVAVQQPRVERQGGVEQLHVTVRNPGKALAFLVRLRVTRGRGGEDVTPVFWDDNYVSLLPGEERELAARYDVASLGGQAAAVELDGWNVATSR